MITAIENVAKAALPTAVIVRIRPAYNAIGRVRGRVLDRVNGPYVDVQANGSTIRINYPPGLRVYFRNQLDGATVENCIPVSECIAPEGTDAIFDVGAYTGLYTALLSQLNPSIPVYAYEPDAGSRQLLRRTVAANDAEVAVCGLVVGGDAGETDFYVSAEGDQGHSIHPNADAFETIQVPSTTIRREIKRHGSERPFVKIDVEGAEDVVLRDLFDRDGPVAGIVELHPDKLTEKMDTVFDLLRNQCDDVTAHGDTSPNHPMADRIGSEPNRPVYSFKRGGDS